MSLDIKNLVLGYEDKIIVNNIDISISKGEITTDLLLLRRFHFFFS